jgi:hypothetical protein
VQLPGRRETVRVAIVGKFFAFHFRVTCAEQGIGRGGRSGRLRRLQESILQDFKSNPLTLLFKTRNGMDDGLNSADCN